MLITSDRCRGAQHVVNVDLFVAPLKISCSEQDVFFEGELLRRVHFEIDVICGYERWVATGRAPTLMLLTLKPYR